MLRKYASLEILESWQEPARDSGLVKSAHRVAFDYEPRPGFLYVRSRMISSRCNDNHDEFPAPEIEAGYRTFLGKPVFVNHHNSNHRRARGVIVAVALHRDRNPDGTPDTWVEGLMEIDALRFPRLARAIIKKRINRTSMGVDVERSTCSACGNKATSPAEYCRHLPALKGKKMRHRGTDGKLREEVIREICAGLSFFENSLLVEEPADPTAYFLGDVDTRGLSKSAANQEGGENYVIPSSRLPRVNIPSGQTRKAPDNSRWLGDLLDGVGKGGEPPQLHHVDVPVRRGYDDERRRGLDTATEAWHDRETMRGMGIDPLGGPPDAAKGLVEAFDRGGDPSAREREYGWRMNDPEGKGPGGFTPLQPGHTPESRVNHLRARWNMIDMPREKRLPPQRRLDRQKDVRARWTRAIGTPACDHDSCPPWEHKSASRRIAELSDEDIQRGLRLPGTHEEQKREDFTHHMDSAWEKMHQIFEPGSTPEGRHSDRNIRETNMLVNRYGVGHEHGHHGYDEDQESPYYEVGHHENGRPTGWAIRHYSDGPNAEITHRATPGEGHDMYDIGENTYGRDANPHGYAHPPAGFGHEHLKGVLHDWYHDQESGAREHLEGQYGDPRIRRWKQRHGSLQAEAAPRQQRGPGEHPFFEHSPPHPQHIVDAYNESDEDARAIGRHWYPEAHHIAKAMAHNSGHSLATTAGVLSAYSPRTLWPVNMMNASRALRDPDNAPGPGSGAMGNHQKSAQRILRGEHYNDVLTRPKTNSFAHLIEHGGDSPEDQAAGKSRVVIDRHALSVAIGRRVTDDDLAKAPISQPKDTLQYNYVADTYRQAAQQLSEQHGHVIHPHEVQAVTWLVQQQRNHQQDADVGGATGKGRINLEINSWKRWHEHAHDQHPEVDHEHFHMMQPGRTIEQMHEPVEVAKPSKKSAGLRYLAYGETAVPPKINTLRQEECPVCGEANVWTGQRCPVCGFVAPPDLFRDPDTDKAAQVRQELEQAGDVTPGGMPQGPADEFGQQGSFPDADAQLFHPDQITPNGVPGPAFGAPAGDMEDGPDEENPEDPGEELAEGEQEEQEEGEQALEAEVLGCPSCGTVFQPGDQGAQEGSRCPACGQAPLVPVDGDDSAEKDQEPSPEGEEVMSTKTATQREQIAGLRRENAVLRAQLRFVAELAGVGPQLDEIRRQADLMNPASPVPDPPQEPPVQSTEEALASGGTEHSGPWPRGTGHTEDDPSRPGTTPGSVTNVPAAQTTTAITPGVEMQTPPANQLIDVTAPVQGTNPSQDGGVPTSQTRIETDVRVDPDPLKASGPGIGGQGNDGTAFPWMMAAREAAGTFAPERENSAIRTMASMRLGRLRVQAGLASGDDLEVGSGIERDGSLSVHDIEREIEVISEMERRRPSPMQRTAQRRPPARSAPSMASAPAPMAYATAASVDEADAFDIFLD